MQCRVVCALSKLIRQTKLLNLLTSTISAPFSCCNFSLIFVSVTARLQLSILNLLIISLTYFLCEIKISHSTWHASRPRNSAINPYSTCLSRTCCPWLHAHSKPLLHAFILDMSLLFSCFVNMGVYDRSPKSCLTPTRGKCPEM